MEGGYKKGLYKYEPGISTDSHKNIGISTKEFKCIERPCYYSANHNTDHEWICQ